MTIELCDCTRVLLDEIGDKHFKRNSVALAYAFALRSSDPTDFKSVNEAIAKRWSMSGLIYIKERAWKIAEGKIQP